MRSVVLALAVVVAWGGLAVAGNPVVVPDAESTPVPFNFAPAQPAGLPTSPAIPAPSHKGGGGFYFTCSNGNTEPHLIFHYNSLYACQDWQGGADFLGERSYLGVLPSEGQAVPPWSAGVVAPICRGGNGAWGGACGFDRGALPPSAWVIVWYPDRGGAYPMLVPGGLEAQGTCKTLLASAIKRGYPKRPNLKALAPGKFAPRCMFQGETYE